MRRDMAPIAVELLGLALCAASGPAAAATTKPATTAPATTQPTSQPARPDGKVLAFDGFDGKLALDWEILHPMASHYSLTKGRGALTIATLHGRFSGSSTDYKNLFLVKCPAQAPGDCQLTICLKSFRPAAAAQQAGLIFFNDEDNYLKCIYLRQGGARRLEVGCEREGRLSSLRTLIEQEPKALWIRTTKRGNRYTVSTSVDGKSFRRHREVAWGDGSVGRVGLLAKDPRRGAPEIDASFDYFEVRAVAARPPGAPDGFFIPEASLAVPQDMAPCAAKLRKIHAAIRKYEKHKGQLPDWLTDLIPKYLDAETAFCARDKKREGYDYQFGPKPVPRNWGAGGNVSFRQWKQRQVKRFGDVVSMVRCHSHGRNRVLNVTVSGKVYWGGLNWEMLFSPCYRITDDCPKPKPTTRPGGGTR
jgi:hypothetical protein